MKKSGKLLKILGIPILVTTLTFGGCDLGTPKHPVEGIGTYTADCETLIAEHENNFWELIKDYMKEERKKAYGMTESNYKASMIIRAYNPDFENPFLYKGEITLPDLNHDGKVLGRPVNGKYTSRKTVPRTGRR